MYSQLGIINPQHGSGLHLVARIEMTTGDRNERGEYAPYSVPETQLILKWPGGPTKPQMGQWADSALAKYADLIEPD